MRPLPTTDLDPRWERCRFLTCSVLPVRRACNCACRFCFSASSLSALRRETCTLSDDAFRRYFAFAREHGATRLVITGGGEPLLRPELCLRLARLGRETFDEIALFTNGARLTPELTRALKGEGLSYLCWSRHHHDDERNRTLMGGSAPDRDTFFASADGLRVRATCVMCAGWIEDRESAQGYIDAMAAYGVRELTFKHTYVAWPRSYFGDSSQNRWAAAHRIAADPFEGEGQVVGSLPWGPKIRRIGENQICHYTEPNPAWELRTGIGRSLNLLADGSVYASLEDARSRLFRLTS